MGTYYAQELESRILNDSAVDQSGSANADVTNWTKTSKIILAVQIGYNGKDTAASAYKLQWRNETDNPGGSFADVGATGEVKYSSSSTAITTDDSSLSSTEDKCTNQDASMTWNNGLKNVGDNTLPDSGTYDIGSDGYTELWWALDLSGGHEGDQYTFQLYNVTAGAAITNSPCDAQITLALDQPSVTLSTADAYAFSTSTPTLQFTGTDPSDSDVIYQIQISTSSFTGFSSLGLTVGYPAYRGIAPNWATKDVFLSDYFAYVYKQTGGTGSFAEYSDISTLSFMHLAVNHTNSDIYLAGYNLYKQTGGTGSFTTVVSLASASSVAVNPMTSDVFYTKTISGEDVYKQTGGTGSFVAQDAPINRTWTAITVNPANGDVYVGEAGDIYKQTGGTGSFVVVDESISGVTGIIGGISVNPMNGDLWVTTRSVGYNVYKQTGGRGSFENQGMPNYYYYYQISVNPANGDVYLCGDSDVAYKLSGSTSYFVEHYNPTESVIESCVNSRTKDIYYWNSSDSDIYKQTGGTGSFVSQATIASVSQIMESLYNGDIYALSNGPGHIYKQTGGTGSFVAQTSTTRAYKGGDINIYNGDVYVVVPSVTTGDIYKQTGGTGSFNALSAGNRNWSQVAVNSITGDVYAITSDNDADIYKQTGGTGSFVAQSQTKTKWSWIAVNHLTGDVWALAWASTVLDLYKLNASGTFVAQSASVPDTDPRFYIHYSTGDLWLYDRGTSLPLYILPNGAKRFITYGETGVSLYGLAINQTSGDIIGSALTSGLYKKTQNIVDRYSSIPSSSGFANTTDGADTSPFDSGDLCSYTVQSVDALDAGTYYWRVRAKDTGSNLFGAWSTPRTFTVSTTSISKVGEVSYSSASSVALVAKASIKSIEGVE